MYCELGYLLRVNAMQCLFQGFAPKMPMMYKSMIIKLCVCVWRWGERNPILKAKVQCLYTTDGVVWQEQDMSAVPKAASFCLDFISLWVLYF